MVSVLEDALSRPGLMVKQTGRRALGEKCQHGRGGKHPRAGRVMTGLASCILVAETVSMRWQRRLITLLSMAIAIGLGWFIAWLGTTPTIDAPGKAFELKSGTVKQGQP